MSCGRVLHTWARLAVVALFAGLLLSCPGGVAAAVQLLQISAAEQQLSWPEHPQAINAAPTCMLTRLYASWRSVLCS